MAFLLFQILDGTLRAKSNKKILVYFQTFGEVVAVESIHDNIYGMVGAALCDHGYQLSVAYCYQTA